MPISAQIVLRKKRLEQTSIIVKVSKWTERLMFLFTQTKIFKGVLLL